MQKLTSEQAWAAILQDKTLRYSAPRTTEFSGELLEWVDGEPVEIVFGKNNTYAYDIGKCHKRNDWTVFEPEEPKRYA
jgi:hypothetical protein